MRPAFAALCAAVAKTLEQSRRLHERDVRLVADAQAALARSRQRHLVAQELLARLHKTPPA